MNLWLLCIYAAEGMEKLGRKKEGEEGREGEGRREGGEREGGRERDGGTVGRKRDTSETRDADTNHEH